MGEFLAIRDGGKTNEEGFFRFLRYLSNNDEGIIRAAHLAVSEKSGTPDKSVDIAIGDIFITEGVYGYYAWNSAVYNLVIADNASGNPRIDAVVAYIDKAVVSSVSNNNPGAFKFMDVQGTPAGSPSAPSDGDIQTAVGASNPFHRLANVAVANGFTQIVNADVTDTRVLLVVGNNKTIRPFTKSGNLSVANDIDFQYVVPPGIGSVSRLDAVVKTAPVGSDLTLRIYNITQGVAVATVTISAGAVVGSTTSITTPTLNAGDRLRLDCTAIGSGTPGADAMVIPT